MMNTTGSLTKSVDRICADLLLNTGISEASFEDVCVLQASRICQPFSPRDLTEKMLGCGLRACKSASPPAVVHVDPNRVAEIHKAVGDWCRSLEDHGYLELDPAPAWPNRDERYCLASKGKDFINSGRFPNGYRVP